jgi:hypothetical protein
MALSSALDCIGECPECNGILTPDTIRSGPFNCPYCAKYIKPIRRPSYLWLRALVCGIIAVVTARRRGFDWSFLIFVVSLLRASGVRSMGCDRLQNVSAHEV